MCYYCTNKHHHIIFEINKKKIENKRKRKGNKKRNFGRRRRRGPVGERGRVIGTYPYPRASGRCCARTTRRLRPTRVAGGCLPAWRGPAADTGAGRRRSWAGRAGSGTRRTPRSRPRWGPRRRRRRAGAGAAAAAAWPATARGTTSCCCCLRGTQAPRPAAPAAPGKTRPRSSRPASACGG